jgi:hypothetical protein
MQNDPIVEEVRQSRLAYTQQFGNDLHAIAEDLHRKEQEHRQQLVSLAPKPPAQQKTA